MLTLQRNMLMKDERDKSRDSHGSMVGDDCRKQIISVACRGRQ